MLVPSLRVPELTERVLTLIAVELSELLGRWDTIQVADAVDLMCFYELVID